MPRSPTSTALCLALWALAACGPEPEPFDCDASGAVCTVVGTGAHGYNGDGRKALQTDLFYPSAVRFFDDGAPLVVDFNNMRLITLDDDDRVVHLAGFGFHGGASDGIEATQSPLENPIDAQTLDDGGFLIAEYHTGRVLRVDASGWLTVVAGTGQIGFGGDGGPAKQAVLSEFAGLTMGDDGVVYIADTENHCIRKVDPTTGIIEMVAGDGQPGDADGDVSQARFNEPWHLSWHDDALFIADRYNHKVRRLDLLTGLVSTVAGTGVAGSDGDGGPALQAQLDTPSAVAVGDDGALWIADRLNHSIRRVSPDGTLTTEVGFLAAAGDGPDQGDAADSALQAPENVAIQPGTGHVWIADSHNSKIRVYVP